MVSGFSILVKMINILILYKNIKSSWWHSAYLEAVGRHAMKTILFKKTLTSDREQYRNRNLIFFWILIFPATSRLFFTICILW
jgi:hypothetical protein